MNLLKTNFLEPLAYPNFFSIKICANQKPQKQNPAAESRAMKIFRFQPHICVQLTFEAKSPLAHKELLFEVPSLRIILSTPKLQNTSETHIILAGIRILPSASKNQIVKEECFAPITLRGTFYTSHFWKSIRARNAKN